MDEPVHIFILIVNCCELLVGAVHAIISLITRVLDIFSFF